MSSLDANPESPAPDIEARMSPQEQTVQPRSASGHVHMEPERPRARSTEDPIRISPVPSNVTPDNVEKGWKEAYGELKRSDEKMVPEYREDIDTLLIFVSHHFVSSCTF
jgi:hypothetical protein